MVAFRPARRLAGVLLALLAFLLGACAASSTPADALSRFATADEAPLVLISFDGFRWDYPRRYHAPHLARMANTGTKAHHLRPVFPTKTFPNHYTLVTGLYPPHHGIISNKFYDPRFDASFSLGNEAAVTDARWWDGEPIWATAEAQGLTAATYFWPGSETPVGGARPTYWRAYDGSVPGAARVQQALRWLDLPEPERPDLITLYFSKVDGAGHDHGPASDAVARAVADMDARLGQLYDGLAARELADSVNVIVTSDHGMAPLSRERVIFLDDYLTGTGGCPDLTDLRVSERSPVLMAWPAAGQTQAVLDALHGAHPELDVYHKSELPASLHFSGSRRIPPVIGVASPGWSITTRDQFEKNGERFTGGAHGYRPSAPAMHGILYARGPAFAPGRTTGPVEAVDLYRLMSRLLGLTPAPNDGDRDAIQALLKPPALP